MKPPPLILTLNGHTSQSTIIKDINIYEFLNAKAL